MEWCILSLLLCLGYCAAQESTTEVVVPTPQEASLLPIIIPMVTTIVCTIAIITVLIIYLRRCHRPGGDKVTDAENGKKPEKNKGIEMSSRSFSSDREAESVLNGAKDQLRELKSLERNLALSKKELSSLLWHASSVLKLIDEGIDEENEPKTLRDELFEEVNKRVSKDPNDKPGDDEEKEVKRWETPNQKANRLFTETHKVMNEGKKHIKEANQRDIDIRNATKDAKKALTQVKDRVRSMRKSSDKKKDGKFGTGAGEEKKPLLK